MPFDKERVSRVTEFLDYCRHTKGRWFGQPFKLLPWQLDRVITPLYGTLRPDGTRQYRHVFIGIGRKNGKTEMSAALGLYGTFADGEMGAENYSAAADREQAAIAFEMASRMVSQEPELQSRCNLYRRSIVVPKTGSFYKVLSSDADTKHGASSHLNIIDELHAHKSRDLYDVLTSSQAARTQPLNIVTTTAGWDRQSVCFEQYSYAKRVAAGEIDDPTFLAVIFESDQDDDPADPATWRKANPSLGDIVSEEFLSEQWRKAKESPAFENTFRRLHLNQWTSQESRWLPVDIWRENATVIDWDSLNGMPCWGGLDLSSTTDLSSFVLVFEHPEAGIMVLPKFYLPEDTIARRSREDRVPYDAWARDGYITVTPGATVDYSVIRADVNAAAEKYSLVDVGVDPWNATHLATELVQDGVEIVSIPQTMGHMTEPTKRFGKLVFDRQCFHDDNPVLRWCVTNAAVIGDDKENLKPAKNKSADRIDGLVAAILALSRNLKSADTGAQVWVV